MTIKYKHGLIVLGRTYGWKDKELYRMPYFRNNRAHGVKKLKLILHGSQKGYYIENSFYNFEILKRLTKEVNYEINEPINTPF